MIVKIKQNTYNTDASAVRVIINDTMNVSGWRWPVNPIISEDGLTTVLFFDDNIGLHFNMKPIDARVIKNAIELAVSSGKELHVSCVAGISRSSAVAVSAFISVNGFEGFHEFYTPHKGLILPNKEVAKELNLVPSHHRVFSIIESDWDKEHGIDWVDKDDT